MLSEMTLRITSALVAVVVFVVIALFTFDTSFLYGSSLYTVGHIGAVFLALVGQGQNLIGPNQSLQSLTLAVLVTSLFLYWPLLFGVSKRNTALAFLLISSPVLLVFSSFNQAASEIAFYSLPFIFTTAISIPIIEAIRKKRSQQVKPALQVAYSAGFGLVPYLLAFMAATAGRISEGIVGIPLIGLLAFLALYYIHSLFESFWYKKTA